MKTRLPTRAIFLSVATALALTGSSHADASVSIAVSFDALIHDSTAVTVATATESRAVWENGRIVTYTHLHVDRAIAGALTTSDQPWVASLGGIIGTVGQVVDGEPTLRVGMPYLLFLRPDTTATAGTYIVTARAQGQFHLKAQSTAPGMTAVKVLHNPGVGEILPAKAAANGSVPVAAADQIEGRAIDAVAKDITSTWGKSHAQ
ncbi:MAG: hypothetical protein ABI461_10835 [Polyangiaceae bacterium]